MFNQIKRLLSQFGQQPAAAATTQLPRSISLRQHNDDQSGDKREIKSSVILQRLVRQPDGSDSGNEPPRFKQVITGEQFGQLPPGTSILDAFRLINPVLIPLTPHEQADHVLPLLWSLSYALTKKQWNEVRERHKQLFPNWEKCDCPKGCKANTLDEHWQYDHGQHVKTFIGAKFICPGCHWLKSPGARIKTWQRPQPTMTKPAHIVDCLGWTQDKVDELRSRDLRESQRRQVNLSKLSEQVQQKAAVALPTPVEHLATVELEKFLASEQSMIAPWRVDLSRMSMYGYSSEEIQVFEKRMYDLAAKRMKTLG